MKKKYRIILFSACLLSVIACFNPIREMQKQQNKKEIPDIEKDFQLVEVNDEYSIRIPNYMKKAVSLHEEASLQYQNVFKETYIIIIDESKSEYIETFKDLGEYDTSVSVAANYRIVNQKYLRENATVKNETKPTHEVINGLDAEMIEIEADVDGVDIYYTMCYIEGDEKMYQILW